VHPIAVNDAAQASSSFCGSCGAARLEGATYCPKCGRAYEAAPGPPASATPAVSASTAPNIQAWAAIAAGIAIVVGSFLPWVSVTAPFLGTFTRSGMDGGDGWATLIVGAILAALGYNVLRAGSPARRWGIFGVGLIGLAFSLLEVSLIQTRLRDLDRVTNIEGASNLASIGVGLWVIVVATIVASGAGLQLAARGGLGTAKVRIPGSDRPAPQRLALAVGVLAIVLGVLYIVGQLTR
jgi:hypothetical protein